VVLEDVLKQVQSDRLSVFAIWMDVLDSDDADAALEAESLIPDPRVVHYWDGENNLGQLYGETLPLPPGCNDFAWDVYFVYAPGIEWQDQLPAPSEWMHQLGQDSRRLDGDELRESILDLLPAWG
jgi:hypothetical protein